MSKMSQELERRLDENKYKLYQACNTFICNIDFVRVEDDSKNLLDVLKHSIEEVIAKIGGRDSEKNADTERS